MTREDPEEEEPTHADHLEQGEADPDCEDCQEANAQMWERLTTPY